MARLYSTLFKPYWNIAFTSGSYIKEKQKGKPMWQGWDVNPICEG